MRFVLAFLCSMFVSQSSAATMDLVITLEFDVVKVSHTCLNTEVGFGPDGSCGVYQQIPLGLSQAGSITWDGQFNEYEPNTYEFLTGKVICSFGCVIGGEFFGSESSFQSSSIHFTPFFGSFDTSYSFDLDAGTGVSDWEDDDEPFFGFGEFEYTNVVVSGLPSVPLPASGLMLITGLGLARVFSRKRKSQTH